VPRPLVLLELAGLLRASNPKEAASIYQQIKKEFPDTAIADQAIAAWILFRRILISPRLGNCAAQPEYDGAAHRIGPHSCSWAMRAEESRGRRYPETPHPYRSVYARDRDRIIHSRAFRRLEAKTQVFTTRYSDHFRNRLTHTLEVAQIARTVAGALELNTELAEALALVHDIGHPPFWPCRRTQAGRIDARARRLLQSQFARAAYRRTIRTALPRTSKVRFSPGIE